MAGAQLSVNIVDYIDNDNYVTAFSWNQNPADPTGYVYGTELPRLVVNEAYAEVINNPADAFLTMNAAMMTTADPTLPYYVNMYAELLNPLTADPNIVDPVTGAGVNNGSVRLEMPAVGAQLSYPIYKLTMTTAQPPVLFNDTLGTPNSTGLLTEVSSYSPLVVNSQQQIVLPAGNNFSGPNGKNQGFYLLGAKANFHLGGVSSTLVPPPPSGYATPPPTGMTGLITPPCPAANLPKKVSFILRRLACPDLPPTAPAWWPANLPYNNPYVSVDYLSGIPVFDGLKYDTNGTDTGHIPVKQRFSMGRKQPYAAGPNATVTTATTLPQPFAFPAQVVPQQPSTLYTNQPQNTFFRHNAVDLPPNGTGLNQTLTLPFNWLVHPDRQLTSPVELLHVSAYPPYMLTQQFMGGSNGAPNYFGHTSMPAWFDSAATPPGAPSSRLYRAMEFFDMGMRAANFQVYKDPVSGNWIQVQPTGRIPGKININTIWDPQILLALADPQGKLSTFTATPQAGPNPPPSYIYNPANLGDPNSVYGRFMGIRSPGYLAGGGVGPGDQPFYGMAGNSQAPGGPSVNDTLFRLNPGVPPNFVSASRIFSINPKLTMGPATADSSYLKEGAPPFVKMELLNKIYNNITTRSNVFAVWLTVGFFDVTDGPLSANTAANPIAPVTLQNAAAIVGVANGGTPGQTAVLPTAVLTPYQTSPANPTLSSATVGLPIAWGSTIQGVPWIIQPGCVVTVGSESVLVTGVTANGFTANFQQNHNPGEPISMSGVLGREVNISEGRNVRHRMFAVVDRTALSLPYNLTTASTVVPLPAGIQTIQGQAVALPQGQSLQPPPFPTAQVGHAIKGAGAGSIIITPPTFPAGASFTPAPVFLPTVAGGGGNAGMTIATAGKNVHVHGTPTASGNAILKVSVTTKTGVTTTYYYQIQMAVEVLVAPQPPPSAALTTSIQGVSSLNYPAQSVNAKQLTPVGPGLSVNFPWQIKQPATPWTPGKQIGPSQGMALIIDPLANPETFYVLNVNQTKANSITAVFYQNHGLNVPVILPGQAGAVPGSIMGHPGPQPRFDHRLNTALVPHYNIIK